MAYRSARSSDYWRGFAVVNGAIGGTAQENSPGSAVRWTPASLTTRKRLLHIHNFDNDEFRPQDMALPEPPPFRSLADESRLFDQGADPNIVIASRRLDLPAVAAMEDWTVHNQGGTFTVNPPTSAYGGDLYTWGSATDRVQYLEYSNPTVLHAWPTTLTQDTARLIWTFFRDGQI